MKSFFIDVADSHKSSGGSASCSKTLGSAGLALHYANVIGQIDTLVSLQFNLMLNTLIFHVCGKVSLVITVADYCACAP